MKFLMTVGTWLSWLLIALVAWGGVGPETALATSPEHAPRRVLVTIDDLPLAMRGGYRSAAHREETVEKLVEVLKKRGIPVVGFFNMSDHKKQPELLATWLSLPGFVPGNHTWSHPNARKTPLDDFLADLERGHKALAAELPEGAVIPFRYPYLNQGSERSKREAIRAKLEALNSRHVPITIETRDWLFAREYLEALEDGDATRAALHHQAWLWDFQEATMEAEFWSRALFGREPPQILLLHANRLNADHLDEAFDWLEARGYTFVTLEETLADPAYAIEDDSVAPIGESHWIRLRRRMGVNAPVEAIEEEKK